MTHCGLCEMNEGIALYFQTNKKIHMNSSMRICVTFAACVLLGACAFTGPTATPWWSISEESIKHLKPGITTQPEVRNTIGTPMLVSNFPRQGEETWDYRYLSGTLVNRAWLTFNEQGVLKSYLLIPDPEFSRKH